MTAALEERLPDSGIGALQESVQGLSQVVLVGQKTWRKSQLDCVCRSKTFSELDMPNTNC